MVHILPVFWMQIQTVYTLVNDIIMNLMDFLESRTK